MNIESFEYALVTAGVGMGVVFFALVVLSGLMILLRTIFRDEGSAGASPAGGQAKPAAGAAGEKAAETGGPDTRDAAGVPRWAFAGALAYLAAEESQMTPHASPWTRRRDET